MNPHRGIGRFFIAGTCCRVDRWASNGGAHLLLRALDQRIAAAPAQG